MNITDKPAFHRYELKLPSVLYKQLLLKQWFKMGPFPTKWIWNKHKKSSAFWAYGYVCKAQKAPIYLWAGQHICATWHKDNYAGLRITI